VGQDPPAGEFGFSWNKKLYDKKALHCDIVKAEV